MNKQQRLDECKETKNSEKDDENFLHLLNPSNNSVDNLKRTKFKRNKSNNTWSRCPWSRKSPASETASHKIISQSLLPDASIDPCLLNLSAVTADLCPLSVATQHPSATSHSLTLPSAWPVAMEPEEEAAMEVTARECEGRGEDERSLERMPWR